LTILRISFQVATRSPGPQPGAPATGQVREGRGKGGHSPRPSSESRAASVPGFKLRALVSPAGHWQVLKPLAEAKKEPRLTSAAQISKAQARAPSSVRSPPVFRRPCVGSRSPCKFRSHYWPGSRAWGFERSVAGLGRSVHRAGLSRPLRPSTFPRPELLAAVRVRVAGLRAGAINAA
jgi:hypothetical protein